MTAVTAVAAAAAINTPGASAAQASGAGMAGMGGLLGETTMAVPAGVHVLFVALGVLSVLTGAAVFIVDSMARATYALAVSFIAVGVQTVLLSQTYSGLVIVLMMIMEMAVMAIFMIMFMGMNPALMPMSMVHGKRASLAISVGVFLVMAVGIFIVPWPARRLGTTGTDLSGMATSGMDVPGSGGSADLTAAIGQELMEPKMLVMAAVSPVMVATIVTGVVLALNRTRYDRFGPTLSGPPADPQPGGVGR